MESFTLTKDKRVSKLISKKHLTVRDKGIFVIMEAPDLGLVVQWDKGTVGHKNYGLIKVVVLNRNSSVCKGRPTVERED